MNTAKYLVDFSAAFSITLLVSMIVTFLYSLLVHGIGVVDWETSFRLAFIFGIALPWINRRGTMQGK